MTELSPTALIVETTAGDPPIDFLGDTAGLVYFMSMAHSERYGAAHPLARAAGIIKRRLRVSLAPLMTFADARAESSEEERLLESLWQEPAPLAESARRAAEAIESSDELRGLTEGFPELPDRLYELAQMAEWAAENGAKVRLTYVI